MAAAPCWLTAHGREVQAREMYALDREHLRRAAALRPPDRRAVLAEALGDLITALRSERP